MAEVGVASSMAAAGFVACMGGKLSICFGRLSRLVIVADSRCASPALSSPGSPKMILQAAEVGIEHSLGLTCDPVDGTVQVPCIERKRVLFYLLYKASWTRS